MWHIATLLQLQHFQGLEQRIFSKLTPRCPASQVPREILLTAQEAHRLFKQENDNMGQVARNKTWPLIWFCLSKATFFGFCHGKSLWKTTIWGIFLFTSLRHRKSKAKDFMGEKNHHYITIVVVFLKMWFKSFSPQFFVGKWSSLTSIFFEMGSNHQLDHHVGHLSTSLEIWHRTGISFSRCPISGSMFGCGGLLFPTYLEDLPS